MIDGHRAAQDVEGLHDFYDAACYSANGSSLGRALVNSGVKFSWLAFRYEDASPRREI